jgi:hypothetical protein
MKRRIRVTAIEPEIWGPGASGERVYNLRENAREMSGIHDKQISSFVEPRTLNQRQIRKMIMYNRKQKTGWS